MATLRWVGADAAVSGSQYVIESDAVGGPGVFAAISGSPFSATTPYNPYTTTLSSRIIRADTSLTLASGTNTANGTYIWIGNEAILLAGESGAAYSGVSRHQLGTVSEIHEAGDTVYVVHESTSYSPSFSSRLLVRVRIAFKVNSGATASVPIEFKLWNYPAPPNNAFTTVYGTWEKSIRNSSSDTGIMSARIVRAIINDGDNYLSGQGTALGRLTVDYTTDNDGAFYFYMPRNTRRQGGDVITVTFSPGVDEEKEVWTISEVPDVDAVHFLEIATPSA